MRSTPSITTPKSKIKFREDLGRRLYIARKRSELTLNGISSLIGIGRDTYTKYESGLSEPKITTLLDIAEATSQPLCWLVFGDEIPKEHQLIKEAEHGE